jgi:predicted amino acid dehydrogenase
VAETQTQTTETQAPNAETKTAEPTKAELRRQKEKDLRAKKPDYRSQGVTMKVLKGNPKKVGSNAHAVYAQYKDALTVADLLKMADDGKIVNAKGEVVSKSYVGACLMWDDRHGFIELVAAAPVAPKAEEPKAEQPKA